MKTEAELKARLKKRLRLRDVENLWNFLKESFYVNEALEGEISFEEFVAKARAIRLAGQQARPHALTASPAGPTPGEARSWALSMLVAADVECDDTVVRFRAAVLNGSLIASADAQSWIENHPETKLPLTLDITITVEKDAIQHDDAGWITLPPGTGRYRLKSTAARVLEYVGTSGWVHTIGVRARGELDRLRRASEMLAKRYHWQPAQATLFLLAGAVPLISRIRTTTALTSSDTWADRVILDVDPAESPDDVAVAFASAVRRNHVTRTRPIKEKHARLAVHALVEHASLTWKERTKRWNEAHPEWACTETHYRRDAIDARNRLLRRRDVGARGSATTTGGVT